MKITADLLTRLGACEAQFDIFVTTFPDGLDVSGEPDPDTVERVVETSLNPVWVARRLLKHEVLDRFSDVEETAWIEYYRGPPLVASSAYRASLTTLVWHYLADDRNVQPEYLDGTVAECPS